MIAACFGALAFAASAFAAEPPAYAPDADIRALQAASAAVMQAVNVVLPQPVQADRLATIKGGLDEVARQSAAADASAKTLLSLTDPPLAWLNKLVKGGGDVVAADARASKAAASVSTARRRWQDAFALADQLKSALNAPAADKDAEKPHKLSELEKIKAWLRQADGPLREAEETAAKFDAPKSELKSKQFNAGEARFELEKAEAELARHAAVAARASGEAKSAVEAFKEGDNATQAKAYQAIGETLDAGKNASNYATIAAGRAGWFGDRYTAAAKAQAKLEELYKALAKSLADAESPLSSAEQALANIPR